jgi:predicted alpha/beta hydrolase family esterase
MKRAFLVHGWGGSPEEAWFPWLKKELENKGFKVNALKMPNTENPKIAEWVPFLAKQVGKCDEETFFAGHSIGCQTIMRYLETLPEDVKVGGVVFVAGWFGLKGLDSYEKLIAKPWLETQIDFSKLLEHTKKFAAIFSDDDHFVPIEDQKIFKEKLGAKIIVESKQGHFDEVEKVPSALDAILEISKK